MLITNGRSRAINGYAMKDYSGIGRWPAVVVAFLVAAIPGLAGGVELDTLYSVTVPMDAVGDSRERAYEEALAQVLVRITGQPGARQDRDLLGLFPEPSRYVLQYARGENDTLIVTLDGDAVSALVERGGYPVWQADRPLTLAWVAVEYAPGNREIIAAAGPEGYRFGEDERAVAIRDAILDAAERRGVPVVFPEFDAIDQSAVTARDVWGGFDEVLLAASRRYDARSVLVGRMTAGAPFDGRWTHLYGSQRLNWSGGGSQVIDQLADSLVRQFAVTGGGRSETIELIVDGFESIDDYGRFTRTLTELAAVEQLRVDAVAGREVRFLVQARVGRERLVDALEFTGLVERKSAGSDLAGAPGRLNYRLRGSLPSERGTGGAFGGRSNNRPTPIDADGQPVPPAGNRER